jgi:hypothetical protein
LVVLSFSLFARVLLPLIWWSVKIQTIASIHRLYVAAALPRSAKAIEVMHAYFLLLSSLLLARLVWGCFPLLDCSLSRSYIFFIADPSFATLSCVALPAHPLVSARCIDPSVFVSRC